MIRTNSKGAILLHYLENVRYEARERDAKQVGVEWKLDAAIVDRLVDTNDDQIRAVAESLATMVYGLRVKFSPTEYRWLLAALASDNRTQAGLIDLCGTAMSERSQLAKRRHYTLVRRVFLAIKDEALLEGPGQASVHFGVPEDLVTRLARCDSEDLLEIAAGYAETGHKISLVLTDVEVSWLTASLQGDQLDPLKTDDTHRLAGLLASIRQAAGR